MQTESDEETAENNGIFTKLPDKMSESFRSFLQFY